MKKILSNKAGVTVLEGVIALGLLALVTAGAFGVLLAASRQTTRPDVREEMILAVERANNELKVYTGLGDGAEANMLNTDTFPQNRNPYRAGNQGTAVDIKSYLPPICDRNNSSFTFTVNGNTITFDITCNGYTL